jgi:UDP-glucuronate decarboxylase
MYQTLRHQDIAEIVERIDNLRPAFKDKRVLITGATGFLGRYFLEVFSALQIQTIGLDNGITGDKSLPNRFSDTVRLIDWDARHPYHPEDNVSFVINAAGIASPAYYKKYPLETIDVTISGLRNSLGVARAHGAKLLFFSSSEIYGDPDPRYIPIPESYRGNVACLGARACYDESKRLGETLCQVYWQQYGVQTRIVRPFNVYGPGMGSRDFRVLPNFVGRALRGEPLKVYGKGDQTRTFTYITDAIVGFLNVLVNGQNGEPYNIGNPEGEISMIDLARDVSKRVAERKYYDLARVLENIHTIDYPDNYPADEPMRRCPDVTKAALHVGFTPQVSLQEGLDRFISWAAKSWDT